MVIVLCVLFSIICVLDGILFIIFFVKRHQRKKTLINQIDYMAKLTHDLRTPLCAIDGYTLLCKNVLDEPEKLGVYIDKIKRVSNQMMVLINDSIDLSKAQNKKEKEKEQKIDLNECLNLCIESIEYQLENKSISFIKHIQIDHSTICTNEVYLKKIVLNLLSNALKYTPSDGTITLFVSERRKGEEKSTYTFVIEDTGCGMSKEFQKHIFEPFAQEGKVENTDVSSSGLGMYIVKQLVDLLQGSIRVESEQSVGTRFIVSLDFKLS